MRKHDAHFTALHVAQEARRRPQWSDNITLEGVGVFQPSSPAKYRNVKTDGYPSAKESRRARQLRLAERSGAIRNLREQVPFELIPAQEGERAVRYAADFCYDEETPQLDGWVAVVEDCKGVRTREYIIKRKLMLFVHGIKVKET